MALLRAKATITRSQVAMTEQLRGILRRATDMPCYMHEKLLQLDDFYCRLLRESLIFNLYLYDNGGEVKSCHTRCSCVYCAGQNTVK